MSEITSDELNIDIYLADVPRKYREGIPPNLPVPVYPNGDSYYIWYKESIPDETDANIISEEYELLYRSVKLAEYKSKLNLYVSAYTVCLAAVTILLLLSPILMAPFSGRYTQVAQASENQPDYTKDYTPPAPPEVFIPSGLTKNSIGYRDELNNVMYIQQPDGSFAIQESSWNDPVKAEKRLSQIKKLGIENLKCSVVKADISGKGTWYRTMVGDFATLTLAREMAGKIKLAEKQKSRSKLFSMNDFLLLAD